MNDQHLRNIDNMSLPPLGRPQQHILSLLTLVSLALGRPLGLFFAIDLVAIDMSLSPLGVPWGPSSQQILALPPLGRPLVILSSSQRILSPFT